MTKEIHYVIRSTFMEPTGPWTDRMREQAIDTARKQGRKVAWNDDRSGTLTMYEAGGVWVYEDENDLHAEWHKYPGSLRGSAADLVAELNEAAEDPGAGWFAYYEIDYDRRGERV